MSVTREAGRPHRWGRRAQARCGALGAIAVLAALLTAQPVAGVGASVEPRTLGPMRAAPALLVPLPSLPLPPLPSLPALPVPTLPPVPLPTLPVPSIPLPTLPVPTPSLALPIPSLPLPTPALPTASLPITIFPGSTPPPSPQATQVPTPIPGSSTGTPQRLASPSDQTATASGILLTVAAETPPPADGAGGTGSDPSRPIAEGRSPLEFVLPGLIIGVPLAAVILIVVIQVAGGAAWLPLVRRWLVRRL
jgi:hypothetical protein